MNNYVGNDIVDITSSEVRKKYRDRRFVKRVLSPNEIEYINCSSHPSLVLWYLWSAKEAAFKALKKLNPDTVFAHRKFEVTVDDIDQLVMGDIKEGILQIGEFTFHLEWDATEHWVHCNAVLVLQDCKRFEVYDYKVMKTADIFDHAHHFTELEALSIYSEESNAVRVLAKALLYQNGLTPTQIIRFPAGKHFSPPRIYFNTYEKVDWDLSLSHDGSYVACLVAKS